MNTILIIGSSNSLRSIIKKIINKPENKNKYILCIGRKYNNYINSNCDLYVYDKITIENLKQCLSFHSIKYYGSFNNNTIFKKIENCIFLNNPPSIKDYMDENNVNTYVYFPMKLNMYSPPACL